MPVTPRAFSKLRKLNLLNDILHSNSCDHCPFGASDRLQIARCGNNANVCILRDVDQNINAILLNNPFEELKPANNRDTHLMRYLLDENNENVIIVLDIPQYALLSADTVLAIREQLESLIYAFLPLYRSTKATYEHHIEMTPEGYIIILDVAAMDADDRSIKPSPALVGYFFALYIGIKMAELKTWMEDTYPDIRIGLHAANLESGELSGSFSTKRRRHFGGDISKTIYLTDVAQPNQILCSQDFVIQLLVEFEETNAPSQNHLMEQLNIPSSVIREMCQSRNQSLDRINPLNMLQDFGYFTHDNGVRYRVFNLVAPLDDHKSSETSSSSLLGNIVPPIARVPIIYRTPTTTNDELNRLVSSLCYADHVMMYGFSNVRMTREIYERYFVRRETQLTPRSFKVIFYSPDQEINDNQRSDDALKDWIKGFLCASWIARQLRMGEVDSQIAINSMRYGFNVFKIMYNASSPQEQNNSSSAEHRDNIRFTLPMPGKAFQLSPVFVINRGDPLYHNFLEISEKYVEEGIKENSDERSITRYVPNQAGNQLIDELFNDDAQAQNDVDYERHDRRCYELLASYMKEGVFDYQRFLKDYFDTH